MHTAQAFFKLLQIDDLFKAKEKIFHQKYINFHRPLNNICSVAQWFVLEPKKNILTIHVLLLYQISGVNSSQFFSLSDYIHTFIYKTVLGNLECVDAIFCWWINPIMLSNG